MDLAQHAQQPVAAIDLGAAAGVVGGIGRLRLVADAGDAQALQHQLHGALQGEEVHVGTVGAQGQHLGLVSHAGAVVLGEVGAAQLIEFGGLVAEVVVPGQDLQHGGQGGGAHDGGVLAQGIQDLQGIPQGGILGQVDLVVVGGADEGVGDDLVVARGAAQGADGVFRLLDGREAPALVHAGVQGVGDVVIAVEPGHLLGDVGVVLHIAAPGGHQDGVAVQLEAQGQQNAAHLRLTDVRAQQAVDLLRLQLHSGGIGVLGDDIHDAVHHLAGAQQLHQLAGPLHGLHGVHRVQALFVPGGGLGAHVQSHGGAADGGAVEVGGLKQDLCGVADDLAVGAAHDAGHAHGLVLVADAQHVGGQLALVAVQGLDGLALPGGADHDLAALHAAEVKGVHGLAVFQHDIVGDIHNVVDGADTGVAQPLPHPGGGGADFYVFYQTGGVPGAQVGIFDLNVHVVGDAAAAALDLRGMEL